LVAARKKALKPRYGRGLLMSVSNLSVKGGGPSRAIASPIVGRLAFEVEEKVSRMVPLPSSTRTASVVDERIPRSGFVTWGSSSSKSEKLSRRPVTLSGGSSDSIVVGMASSQRHATEER